MEDKEICLRIFYTKWQKTEYTSKIFPYNLQYHRFSEGTEMYKIWSPPSSN